MKKSRALGNTIYIRYTLYVCNHLMFRIRIPYFTLLKELYKWNPGKKTEEKKNNF